MAALVSTKYPINLGADFSLPVDAVTQKIAQMGRTGSGKTFAAMKLVEELLYMGAQVVILDPVGVWYGLRLGKDGKSPGIAIPVIGGLHGDIPLESSSGALIADIVVDRDVSMVVDVSQFDTDSDQHRFATAFARRLFDRRKQQPAPMMLVIEEAQEFIPQEPQEGEKHMLHAFQRLCKIGRNFGIGVDLISQRPQEVSKKVLNMTELFFCFQMTGPQERQAIKRYVSEKGEDVSVVDTLPKLPVGSAHVWSPQWLGISRTVRIGDRKTFNASSTPQFGAKRREARELTPIDLKNIQQAMAATIEKARDADPELLRRRIAELEQKTQRTADPEAIRKAESSGYDRGVKDTRRAFDPLVRKVSELSGLVPAAETHAEKMADAIRKEPVKAAKSIASDGDQSVGDSGLRRMLIALAQRNGLTAKQVGVRASISSSSGTFGTYLSTGRSNGWIKGTRDRLEITDDGLAALGTYTPLPTGRDLARHWIGALGDSGSSRMLTVLIDAYPRTMSAHDLGQKVDLSSSSGTFGTYLSRLRTLELITGSRGDLRAHEDLV